MKIEPFTFVNRFTKDSPFSRAVDGIREECIEMCPEAKRPKLYNHSTVFPPLWAPPDEMRVFTAGLSILSAQYGEEESLQNEVKVGGIDFFRNPGNIDAMILRLLMKPSYKARVEFVRRHMHEFSKWEFPLLGDEYNPHICFVEGEGIYEKLAPHTERFEKKVKGLTFHLSFPEIMIKRGEKPNTWWEKFDITSGFPK